MLISEAWAQASGGAGGSDFLVQLFPLILIFVVFYFLLIRPQTKRAKEHRAMVSALEVGAEVVTNGGILGKVAELGEQDRSEYGGEQLQVHQASFETSVGLRGCRTRPTIAITRPIAEIATDSLSQMPAPFM